MPAVVKKNNAWQLPHNSYICLVQNYLIKQNDSIHTHFINYSILCDSVCGRAYVEQEKEK